MAFLDDIFDAAVADPDTGILADLVLSREGPRVRPSPFRGRAKQLFGGRAKGLTGYGAKDLCKPGQRADLTGCQPRGEEAKAPGEAEGRPSKIDRRKESPAADPAAGRPSKVVERRVGARLPDVKPEDRPPLPPPKGKSGERKAGGFTATGLTNTEFGDWIEEQTAPLGLRSILPPGKRQNPLDREWDHAGYGFELKGVTTAAIQYKVRWKKGEREEKEAYARKHRLKPVTAIAVFDHEKGEVHVYYRLGLGAWELTPGNAHTWNCLGVVKVRKEPSGRID